MVHISIYYYNCVYTYTNIDVYIRCFFLSVLYADNFGRHFDKCGFCIYIFTAFTPFSDEVNWVYNVTCGIIYLSVCIKTHFGFAAGHKSKLAQACTRSLRLNSTYPSYDKTQFVFKILFGTNELASKRHTYIYRVCLFVFFRISSVGYRVI